MNQHAAHGLRWIFVAGVVCIDAPAISQSKVAESSALETAGTQQGVAVLPGYVHELSRSRFRIGEKPAIESETPTLRRWRGAGGAWVVDLTNGSAIGVVNAKTLRGDYILDEATQAQKVKAYFIEAGLPADQIHDVLATFEVGGGGAMNDTSPPKDLKLRSINSILTRSAKGVPVVESVAWAKMTTSGEVDMEYVFWPPIKMELVDRAAAFARRMAEPAERATYLAKLPGQVYRDGGVVIHHTNPSVHSAPIAYVSFDVTLDESGSSAMRHFDENGNEFRLLHEQTPALDLSKKSPPTPK